MAIMINNVNITINRTVNDNMNEICNITTSPILDGLFKMIQYPVSAIGQCQRLRYDAEIT